MRREPINRDNGVLKRSLLECGVSAVVGAGVVVAPPQATLPDPAQPQQLVEPSAAASGPVVVAAALPRAAGARHGRTAAALQSASVRLQTHAPRQHLQPAPTLDRGSHQAARPDRCRRRHSTCWTDGHAQGIQASHCSCHRGNGRTGRDEENHNQR